MNQSLRRMKTDFHIANEDTKSDKITSLALLPIRTLHVLYLLSHTYLERWLYGIGTYPLPSVLVRLALSSVSQHLALPQIPVILPPCWEH